MSYVGSLKNAPNDTRKLLHEQLQNESSISYQYYYGNDWRHVMSNSRYSLVPRGFGRTAYHLMETLQMGLVPIYIYLDNDIPWIPYKDLFHQVGYSTTFNRTVQLVKVLKRGSLKELQQREKQILSLRQSHFSINGTLHQIGYFMKGTDNDLRCQPLPKTAIGID
jgi:hypothetical protein